MAASWAKLTKCETGLNRSMFTSRGIGEDFLVLAYILVLVYILVLFLVVYNNNNNNKKKTRM